MVETMLCAYICLAFAILFGAVFFIADYRNSKKEQLQQAKKQRFEKYLQQTKEKAKQQSVFTTWLLLVAEDQRKEN